MKNSDNCLKHDKNRTKFEIFEEETKSLKESSYDTFDQEENLKNGSFNKPTYRESHRFYVLILSTSLMIAGYF